MKKTAPLTSGGDRVLNPAPPPYTTDEMAEMMATAEWHPSERLTRLMGQGLKLTLQITPSAVIVWALAPDELKYEIRKLTRWLPWGIRYGLWWLRQEGL